jgi:hypothetical protein
VIKHFPNMIFRAATAAVLSLAAGTALSAQTNDEARLTLGMAAGYIGSHVLWTVPNQPILSSFDPPSIFRITRSTHSDITIGASGVYYPSPHVGYIGEFTYVGLGNSDGCQIAEDGGDALLRAVCDALNGRTGSASIVTVNGGVMLRPFSRSFVQPYLKVVGGLAFTPSSTIAVQSVYGYIADTALVVTVYDDQSWKPIRPTATLGFGISTAPSSGYQLHVEARETWLGLGEVTGPTSRQGFIPDHRTVYKGYFSFLVGFDIVLAKRRGRRY